MALKLKLNLIENDFTLPNLLKIMYIKIDQNLNWKYHINDIAVKLNRANALLFKLRNFANVTILKTIYFAIFDSHINYASWFELRI